MLAGLNKTSENVSEAGAREAGHQATRRRETRRSVSIPHEGAILRHDPAVFD